MSVGSKPNVILMRSLQSSSSRELPGAMSPGFSGLAGAVAVAAAQAQARRLTATVGAPDSPSQRTAAARSLELIVT